MNNTIEQHKRSTSLLIKQLKEEHRKKINEQQKQIDRLMGLQGDHLGYLTEYALRLAVRERHGHQVQHSPR